MQVGAVALEPLAGRNVHGQIEVPRRPPLRAGVPRTGDAKARAPLHSGRNLDLQLALLPHLSVAAAVGTLVPDDLARAAAVGAGGDGHELSEERALHLLHLPSAPADRAGFGLRAGLRPRAAARLAPFPAGDLDLPRHALRRLKQRDAQHHLQVAAPARGLRVAGAPPHAAAEHLGEEVPEEVAKVHAVHAAEGAGAVGGAELVVARPLLLVAQHGVGRVDLLELLLRLPVARVRVRMVLPHELTVGLLYVRLSRVPGDFEDSVQIFHLNRHPTAGENVPPKNLKGAAGLLPSAVPQRL